MAREFLGNIRGPRGQRGGRFYSTTKDLSDGATLLQFNPPNSTDVIQVGDWIINGRDDEISIKVGGSTSDFELLPSHAFRVSSIAQDWTFTVDNLNPLSLRGKPGCSCSGSCSGSSGGTVDGYRYEVSKHRGEQARGYSVGDELIGVFPDFNGLLIRVKVSVVAQAGIPDKFEVIDYSSFKHNIPTAVYPFTDKSGNVLNLEVKSVFGAYTPAQFADFMDGALNQIRDYFSCRCAIKDTQPS